MTTVLLIRHGEIENPKKILYGGIIDLPLSKVGKDQMVSVARKLKEKGYVINRIYASDLKRAIASAEIIAREFGIKKIAIEKKLRDIHIPALAGKPVSIRAKIHKQGIDEYSEQFVAMGNESREQIVERMESALKKIIRENTGKTIGVVSHGDPIRFLLYRLERPKEEIPSMHTLVDSEYPEKGEVVELKFNGEGDLLGRKFIFSR